MSKLAFSFGIILFGLLLGYITQVLARNGRIQLPVQIDSLRQGLQRIALLFLNPVAIVGAIWTVNLKTVTLAALPFVGLFALLAGGGMALCAARMFKMPPRQAGALYGCGAFTNIGSIGALVCFVFLGEKGFALVPIYKLFEELSYYGVGFPIAKYFSSRARSKRSGEHLGSLARDPFILVALVSLITGGLLNAADVSRPGFYAIIVAVFVPLGTVMLLMSIGLALKFKKVFDYLAACMTVSVIKFTLVPILATSLAFSIGFQNIDHGLPLKVVMILSCMPVAFNALIPPSIYDLDLDMANSCWFFTTALLIAVLPTLLFILNRI